MRRSLIHYWPLHLAVVAGAGVATAVLTGALVVGDSIRASLADLTLDRLGRIETTVAADRLVPQDLAARLETALGREAEAVPLLALRGSAVAPESGARATRVAVWGIEPGFAGLFPGDAAAAGLDFGRRPGQLFPSVIVNQGLARELGAGAGDEILLAFQHRGEVPQASLLGDREAGAALGTLRLTIAAVVPDRGAGRFALSANQSLALNAFVELERLQRRLARPDEINLIAVAGAAEEPVAGALRQAIALRDLGLELQPAAGSLSLESREFVLRPPVVRAAEELAGSEGRGTLPILTYLANRMTVRDRLLPYSTVSALPLPPPEEFGAWRTDPASSAADDATSSGLPPIVLNRWAADDLDAQPGDRLRMTYFEVGARDELTSAEAGFEVSAIVELSGLAADRALTPEFPGIADANSIAAWDPPFPVELDLIRDADESYWRSYRATPKAFVPLDVGTRLWRNRFGAVTALRIGLRPGERPAAEAHRLGAALAASIAPAAAGLTADPVRRRGLEAASGTTDFSGLFVGFSLFLIVAAALLVALLFRLGIERRAGELGLRLAAGFPLRAVRRQLLAEGAVLAAAGGLLGLLLAVAYSHGVLAGLATWWAPILEPGLLRLELRPATLALGFATSLLVVLISIALSIRRLQRLPARALLAGQLEDATADRRPGRRAAIVAASSLALAAALVALALVSGADSSPALFFALGAALLTAGFAGFALWCRGAWRGGRRLSLVATAGRNSARNPGRSLLSVILVGSACFVLVAVAANRREAGREALQRDSGTGGFTLVAESEIPLDADLGSPAGRSELGLGGTAAEQLARTRVLPLRLRPGEDASCLNLYQPERPRLLGLTAEFVERGGFRFRQTARAADNPWTLLADDLGPGVVPAIGDANSVQWILHLGLGDELELEDDHGEPLRLRIVATLDTSLFQSELLIADAALLRHFPDSAGFSYFLAETPPDAIEATSLLLEEGLARYGFDATPAAEKLESFLAVEHMYLDTFQALGGLGLLLGTLGLAVVLARSVIERRKELAILRAFGFRRATLGWLVVGENAFLLIVGLVIGTVAGLAAVAPHLAGSAALVPWGSLSATLALVLTVGLLAGAAAVALALRTELLPALKTDR